MDKTKLEDHLNQCRQESRAHDFQAIVLIVGILLYFYGPDFAFSFSKLLISLGAISFLLTRAFSIFYKYLKRKKELLPITDNHEIS